MAQPKKAAGSNTTFGERFRLPAEDKIARLLGLLLVRDMKNRTDQVPLLRSAGFEVAEVAAMLGITENHVKVADHTGRKKRKGAP